MRKTSSTLTAIVLALLLIGIVILASTSNVRGAATFRDPYYFLKRQLAWLAVALAVGAALFRFDYHLWHKLALPLAVASVVLLGLVFVPGIGVRAGGSNRWLRLGPFSLQPSEFAKLGTVIVLARWMAATGRRAENLKEGLILPLLGLGLVLVLMIMEPDFGTTMLTGLVGLAILFAGGTRLGYLAITAMLGGSAFVLMVMQDPLRMNRVLALFMPERFPATAYHLAQSKKAFMLGEWTGVGLGNSIQKQFYLPESHTDFIFAIIGEELGFLGTCSVLILFTGLLICGLVICRRAPDPFGRLLAFGLTMMITLQAAINIGVVTGCLPTKGLPLPFISYGGSSLVASVACAGILLNVAHHCAGGQDDHTRPIKDRTHRL